MKQTTKRFISMILGLVLLVSALVIYFEFIQPAYDDAQNVKSEQLSRQAFLDSEKSIVKQVQNLINTHEGQGQIQQAVSAALPAEPDLAGALAQLYGLAQNSGLGMQSVSVSAAGVRNVPTSASVTEKAVGTATFRMRVGGTYEDLKSFISKLETNIRIFDLKSLDVRPIVAVSKVVQNLYSYDIAVATYYQLQ